MSKKEKSQLFELGDQIAQWRRTKGLTQSQLESMAGLAHNALSRVENNLVSPRLMTVERIASALGISVEELQFRSPAVIDPSTEVSQLDDLMTRLNGLDEARKQSMLEAFHLILDQVE
jgi:transcriptional regulator with XRE-family HTH domain